MHESQQGDGGLHPAFGERNRDDDDGDSGPASKASEGPDGVSIGGLCPGRDSCDTMGDVGPGSAYEDHDGVDDEIEAFTGGGRHQVGDGGVISNGGPGSASRGRDGADDDDPGSSSSVYNEACGGGMPHVNVAPDRSLSGKARIRQNSGGMGIHPKANLCGGMDDDEENQRRKMGRGKSPGWSKGRGQGGSQGRDQGEIRARVKGGVRGGVRRGARNIARGWRVSTGRTAEAGVTGGKTEKEKTLGRRELVIISHLADRLQSR